jgi:uncharacterized protein DUF429
VHQGHATQSRANGTPPSYRASRLSREGSAAGYGHRSCALALALGDNPAHACKAAWIGITLGDGQVAAYTAARIDDLVAAVSADGPTEVVGIDIPIGLADISPRQADHLVRAGVGRRWPSYLDTGPGSAPGFISMPDPPEVFTDGFPAAIWTRPSAAAVSDASAHRGRPAHRVASPWAGRPIVGTVPACRRSRSSRSGAARVARRWRTRLG